MTPSDQHPSVELIVHQLGEISSDTKEIKSAVGELASKVQEHDVWIQVQKDRIERTADGRQKLPVYLQTLFGGIGLILAYYVGTNAPG